ncbi:MAG: DNA polymerase III subunit gamma/tau C-terminal domain-containing protein, partial [Fluviibacter sp.]
SQMASGSLSFESALDDLSRLAVSLQLMQFDASEGSQEFSSLAEDDADQLRLLATQCSRTYAQLIYQVATKARADLRLAPDSAHGFLMAMLRLLTVHPGHVSAVQPLMSAASDKTAAPRVISSPGLHVQLSPSALIEPVAQVETQPAKAERPQLAPSSKPSAPGSALSAESWPQTVERLGLKGMARELVQHSAFANFSEGLIALNLPATHRQLLMPASEQRVAQALSDLLSEQVRVRFDVVEQVGVTAAVLKKEAAEERQNTAVAAIESDPVVQELIDVFDAKLIDGSIRPVTG